MSGEIEVYVFRHTMSRNTNDEPHLVAFTAMFKPMVCVTFAVGDSHA